MQKVASSSLAGSSTPFAAAFRYADSDPNPKCERGAGRSRFRLGYAVREKRDVTELPIVSLAA